MFIRLFITVTIHKPRQQIFVPGLTLIAASQVPTFCSALHFVFVSGSEDDSLGPCCLLRIHFSLAVAGYSELVASWVAIHDLSSDFPLF